MRKDLQILFLIFMTKESTFKRRKIGSLTNQCVTAIKEEYTHIGVRRHYCCGKLLGGSCFLV